jgi:hypothetical protein
MGIMLLSLKKVKGSIAFMHWYYIVANNNQLQPFNIVTIVRRKKFASAGCQCHFLGYYMPLVVGRVDLLKMP